MQFAKPFMDNYLIQNVELAISIYTYHNIFQAENFKNPNPN
jgi:hypothetical protein